MIREVVDVSQYRRIAKEHKFFLWHFLQKNQFKSRLGMYSIFDEEDIDKVGAINQLSYILDRVDIPYFESYTEESMDFLLNLGIKGSFLYKPVNKKDTYVPKEFFYSPLIIGFSGFKYVKSTSEICYCPEGLIEVIYTLNPDFILNSNFD